MNSLRFVVAVVVVLVVVVAAVGAPFGLFVLVAEVACGAVVGCSSRCGCSLTALVAVGFVLVSVVVGSSVVDIVVGDVFAMAVCVSAIGFP